MSNHESRIDESHDIIIAGAGLSGLTLATELARRPFFDQQRILLIDRDDKRRNDRTWCFWATDAEPLPPTVFRTWDKAFFYSDTLAKPLEMADYRYRMVRGGDYYAWARQTLAQHANIEWLQADVVDIDAATGTVQTNQGTFQGRHVFNSAFLERAVMPQENSVWPASPFSLRPKSGRTPNHAYLLQHFKGWYVRTSQPFFDPSTITLMDFRVPQAGETRFVYVLPFSECEALIEYTAFSPALYKAEAYDEALADYCKTWLQLTDYVVEETEFGVIPMTDYAFAPQNGGNVHNIGTAGGFVKASSGYAFTRVQRKIRALVDDWERRGAPQAAKARSAWRYRMYDSILLRVLSGDGAMGSPIFSRLFARFPASFVFRFLDEQTSVAEDIAVMNSQLSWRFIRAAIARLPHARAI